MNRYFGTFFRPVLGSILGHFMVLFSRFLMGEFLKSKAKKEPSSPEQSQYYVAQPSFLLKLISKIYAFSRTNIKRIH
jgi:hypothetical protein